jgi:methionyl-tRNA formyltransferase
MNVLKIAYFGDGAWATKSLQRLIKDGHSIATVVLRSQPSDQTLPELAKELGIDTLQPKRVNADDFSEALNEIGPDLCISMSYDQIIRRRVLEVPRKGFINFHAGKLPLYRGRNVINWAIINNETEIGLTAHYLDEGIDTGDIILQKTLPIEWQDTYSHVLSKVTDGFPALMSETVRQISDGRAYRRSQSGLQGTYYGRRKQGDESIDWSKSSLETYNKIQAITHPGPGATTELNGNTCIVWTSSYDPSWPNYVATPGEVIGRIPDAGIMVKSSDSTLLVKSIQMQSNAERVADFPIGTRFGISLIDEVMSLKNRIDALEREIHAGKISD